MNPWDGPPSTMDHRQIDEQSIAARYIDNTLTAEERAAFEAHMVDCQECTDRILLAGIFHARQPGKAEWPLRARFVAKMAPWQLVLVFAITALLLVGIPALLLPLYFSAFRK